MRSLTDHAMSARDLREGADMFAARAPTQAFARVEVHATAAPVSAAWALLENDAPCSIYQTRGWLLPWIETLAPAAGVVPCFVLARAADERPVALLCLGLTRRGPMRIATWLGGKDANFQMPLLAPSAAWSRREVMRLLRAARRGMGPCKPDLFALANQPLTWHGAPNPFAALAHQPSPSAAYGTALSGDAEALFAAKLSKETRKKLRKKEARLAGLGTLTHDIATGQEAQAVVVDAFLAMRNARFRAQNIASPFAAPAMRDFIAAAAAPAGAPTAAIELHTLRVGERIVAVYGGAAHQGQWSGMFNAFDADPAIAASSPGDLLLMRIIAKACETGLSRFDLGIGEARYKAALCDETIALFDAFVPMTTVGRLAALALGARQHAKRGIKANPRLFALAKRIKALG